MAGGSLRRTSRTPQGKCWSSPVMFRKQRDVLEVADFRPRPGGRRIGGQRHLDDVEAERARRRRQLREAINTEVEVAGLKRIAMKNGMKTLHQDSILKVKMGLTTIEEALSNVPPDLIL